MRCVICDKSEWENVDQYRLVPKGMCVCKNCGFVSYPDLYKTDDEIKEYYKNNYKEYPVYQNLTTGVRKTCYHKKFLGPIFKKWSDDKLEKPVIGEIGSAMGVTLDFIKKNLPEAEVYGTEWSKSLVRNAYHEYGIKLTDELPKKHKYDLLISFKVAEHQIDIDKKLLEYRELLKDDGYLYISVPTWFREMQNPGTDGFDLEFYYHTNHINSWSEKLFKSLLKKCGFKICVHDTYLYGDTFICMKDDIKPLDKSDFEDVENIKFLMSKIYEAAINYSEQNIEAALKAYPNFPFGYYYFYEKTRGEMHKDQQQVSYDILYEKYLKPAFENCPQSAEPYKLAVDLCMRYEFYEKAIAWAEKGLALKPDNLQMLFAIGQSVRTLAEKEKKAGNNAKAIQLYKKSREVTKYVYNIDIQVRPEAINWIYYDNAQIPIN